MGFKNSKKVVVDFQRASNMYKKLKMILCKKNCYKGQYKDYI